MKKILIVDDEEEIREILKKKFEQNKYIAMTAQGGQEAIDICKFSLPDLVLLDIAMPGMDGYETCIQLKKEKATRDIPVLFLTAKELNLESVCKRCNELDVCGYIPKPSVFEELLAKVNEILGNQAQ